MTTRTPRGRAVQPKRSPLRLFYPILAIVALVGGTILVLMLAQRAPTTPATTPTTAARPLNAPTGTTDEGFAYKGSPDAPVTVVEYADFQCPACARAFEGIEPAIDRQYVETGKVRFIFHDFPLRQHPNAIPAAAAARCALAQNAFWPMHDRLFSTQEQWATAGNARAMFAGYAGDLGLDMTAYNACVAAPATTTALQAAFDAGVRAGVNATPTYVVDGRTVDATQLQAAIDQALAAKGQ